jgi:hypothetical protein
LANSSRCGNAASADGKVTFFFLLLEELPELLFLLMRKRMETASGQSWAEVL